MDEDSNKLFEIRSTRELEMLLSDCALLIYLSGLTRNVPLINDKLPKLAVFVLLLILIRYTSCPHEFVKSQEMCYIFIVFKDLEIHS